jgi:hypothetical protein
MLLRAVGPTVLNSLGHKIVRNVGLLLPCPISTPLKVEWAVLRLTFLMLHLFNLSKIPNFPQAIDALHELFATPHPEREAIINMTCALMDVAAEYQIPLHCTLGSEPLRSGGGGIPNTCNEFNVRSTDPTSLDLCASTVINRDNLDEIPIFSLISPSWQATVPAEMGTAHQSYLQAAAV